jgi:hypothetical protein
MSFDTLFQKKRQVEQFDEYLKDRINEVIKTKEDLLVVKDDDTESEEEINITADNLNITVDHSKAMDNLDKLQAADRLRSYIMRNESHRSEKATYNIFKNMEIFLQHNSITTVDYLSSNNQYKMYDYDEPHACQYKWSYSNLIWLKRFFYILMFLMHLFMIFMTVTAVYMKGSNMLSIMKMFVPHLFINLVIIYIFYCYKCALNYLKNPAAEAENTIELNRLRFYRDEISADSRQESNKFNDQFEYYYAEGEFIYNRKIYYMNKAMRECFLKCRSSRWLTNRIITKIVDYYFEKHSYVVQDKILKVNLYKLYQGMAVQFYDRNKDMGTLMANMQNAVRESRNPTPMEYFDVLNNQDANACDIAMLLLQFRNQQAGPTLFQQRTSS